MVCGQCAAALPPDNDFVTCKGCNRGFHYSCTNVRETFWRKKSMEDKASWRCSFCKAEPEGATQQTVTPVGLEQGAAAILAFLEAQQRKQEKEKEEDQERRRQEREEDQERLNKLEEKKRREKEEDQERMRKEREEDRERLDGRLDKLDQRLDGKLCDIGNLVAQQNEKIEELEVQIRSKTEEE